MKSVRSCFTLILILTTNFCDAQFQNQRFYGDTLHYAYIVLYDNDNQVTAGNKLKVEQRLEQLERIIEKESLGKLFIDAVPVYVNVQMLDLKNLDYRLNSFFEWMDLFFKKEIITSSIDVISFTPAVQIPWADDSRSIGFYLNGRVCFSLEYYPYDHTNNVRANSLLIHKMFHGFGYNHQNINMHALKLLNWELGFPVNTGLDLILREKDGYDAFYFNRHILDVLDPSENKYSLCLDCNGLVSKSNKYRKGLTEDAYGPYCYDADHDGILDKEDDYFLSSTVKGPDQDQDGIPDKLDLIPWNHIRVSGNIVARKINLIAKEDTSEICFTGDQITITGLIVKYYKKVPVPVKPDHFPGCFPATEAVSYKGNEVMLVKDMKKTPIVRIEVHYTFNGQSLYRPYYFYFNGTPELQIINEREWFYFLRFGADIPENIKFSDVDTYDSNYDGLLDTCEFLYFNMPDDYDWDGDGFADRIDKLPTVYGKFKNEFICGVKDSDNDGLADPGCLDFSGSQIINNPDQYFGEIHRVIGINTNYDRSPYMHNNPDEHGQLEQ
ncbi:MAG: hypothetical protein JW723_15730 [Bacteroidales bacterium]|nr:hypothetical protein [Bacteroidales bacterium]